MCIRPYPSMPALLSAFLLAIGPLSAADSVGLGDSFKGPVGLQLYSLRGEFQSRGVPATLKQVQNYGIRNVELAGTYNLSPERFKEMLVEHHLNSISGHFPFERLRDDIDGVVADAKTLGLKYVGCAWVPHQGEFDEAECREVIRVFNAAGKTLKENGMQLFYHAHGYEFQPHGDGTLFDLMVSETHSENVKYQMDVFWIVHPGQDPVAFLKKYPNRWDLMHLKDMKKGVKTGVLTGQSDVKNDVVLGTGQMDWPAILEAAKEVGVKYYFIEDESPTAEKQIPQSLEFLEKVDF